MSSLSGRWWNTVAAMTSAVDGLRKPVKRHFLFVCRETAIAKAAISRSTRLTGFGVIVVLLTCISPIDPSNDESDNIKGMLQCPLVATPHMRTSSTRGLNGNSGGRLRPEPGARLD